MWFCNLYMSGLAFFGISFGVIWGVINLAILLYMAYFYILRWIEFITTTDLMKNNSIINPVDRLLEKIDIYDVEDLWCRWGSITLIMAGIMFGWPIAVTVGTLVGLTFLIKYTFDMKRKLEELQKKEE